VICFVERSAVYERMSVRGWLVRAMLPAFPRLFEWVSLMGRSAFGSRSFPGLFTELEARSTNEKNDSLVLLTKRYRLEKREGESKDWKRYGRLRKASEKNARVGTMRAVCKGAAAVRK
jgi:hypothetical protein